VKEGRPHNNKKKTKTLPDATKKLNHTPKTKKASRPSCGKSRQAGEKAVDAVKNTIQGKSNPNQVAPCARTSGNAFR